jgi:hypothetical protein
MVASTDSEKGESPWFESPNGAWRGLAYKGGCVHILCDLPGLGMHMRLTCRHEWHRHISSRYASLACDMSTACVAEVVSLFWSGN